MQVRLFGERAGVPVPVRGIKQRALLALLALRPGQPVSADRLIDVLWGDGLAAHPADALQAQMGPGSHPARRARRPLVRDKLTTASQAFPAGKRPRRPAADRGFFYVTGHGVPADLLGQGRMCLFM